MKHQPDAKAILASLLTPSPGKTKCILTTIVIIIVLTTVSTLMMGQLSLRASNGRDDLMSDIDTTSTFTAPKPILFPEDYETLPPYPCTVNYTSEDPSGLNVNPNMKIIDYILLNNEMDMLEIRLRTILKHVDHLIIAESPMTFTGKPRKLILNKFLEKQKLEWGTVFVEKIKSKLVHVIMPGLPKAKDGWEREKTYRRLGLSMGLKKLGLINQDETTSSKAINSDLTYAIISTDLDEIPRSSVLRSLQKCQEIPHAVLQLAFYYYAFQFRNIPTGYWDQYPRILRFDPKTDSKAPDAQDIRVAPADEFPKVLEAGWHCSFCFKNFQEIVVKVKAYSHTEHNQAKYFQREHFLKTIRQGLDLFDRTDNQMRFVDNNFDYPDWIKENLDRFMYLVDRQNEYAGFFDVKKEMEAEAKAKNKKFKSG
ncbi:hypothetical protein HDU76_005498 [Blyttiomyces sp. JEL0837]|nr:hypothetical protein HDU76_005498 [Blyttiomyces sp. JEL0837]